MSTRREQAARVVALLPAVGLYGVAFGATSSQAGLPVAMTVGLSLLVFAGGSQFAAVGVIASGGSPASAVITGLLVNARMLAFGIAVAPLLPRRLGERLAASHFVIDETVALATAEPDPSDARRVFWWTAGALWVVWNLTALAGATLLGRLGDPATFGLDAAIPAAFLGLIAPRLRTRDGASAALIGAVVALVLVPLVPPGVPVMASAGGAVVVMAAGAGRGPQRPVTDVPERSP